MYLFIHISRRVEKSQRKFTNTHVLRVGIIFSSRRALRTLKETAFPSSLTMMTGIFLCVTGSFIIQFFATFLDMGNGEENEVFTTFFVCL